MCSYKPNVKFSLVIAQSLSATWTAYLMLYATFIVALLEVVVTVVGPDRGGGVILNVTASPLEGGDHTIFTVAIPTPYMVMPTLTSVGPCTSRMKVRVENHFEFSYHH